MRNLMTLIALLMILCLGNDVMGQVGGIKDHTGIGDNTPRQRPIAVKKPNRGDNDQPTAILEANSLTFYADLSTMRSNFDLASIFSGPLTAFAELQVLDHNNSLVTTIISYPSLDPNFFGEVGQCNAGCLQQIYETTETLIFNLAGDESLDGVQCHELENYKFRVIAKIGIMDPISQFVRIEPHDYADCLFSHVVWPSNCYYNLNGEDSFTFLAFDFMCK